MREERTVGVSRRAALALLVTAIAMPTPAAAQGEGAGALSAPHPGSPSAPEEPATPAVVAPPAAAPPVAAESPGPCASDLPELQRLALTYGTTKARRTVRAGFVLTGAALVLSIAWIAKAQPLGILEDLPPRVDPDYQPNVDGGAIAIGTITWASIIAFGPVVGRGARFARMHPEARGPMALRAIGWSSYVGFVAYGLYLQTRGLVYTGISKGQAGGAAALGVGSLLLLSIDALLVSRRASRLAAEQGLDEEDAERASVGPLFGVEPGGALVVGAQGRF